MPIVPPQSSGEGGFTLGPEQNIFTGSDRTSAETARDLYASNNPLWILDYNSNTNLNIRLEYTDGPNQVALFQVRDGDGLVWLDNSSATGVQGETGPAGATGNSYFFSSITERDAFFGTSPNEALLKTNLPIQTNSGGDIVTTFVWKGEDSPVSYDNTQWILASVQSGTGSFLLGDAHRMSSSGENVSWTNLASGVHFHPTWQTYEDGNTSVSRVRLTLPDITISNNVDDIVNPVWNNGTTATTNQSVKKVVIDIVNPVSNLVVDLDIDGVDFYRESFGSFSPGLQVVTLNPPVDVIQGQLVTFALSDDSGNPVVVKGDNTILDTMGRPIPYQVATIASWTDDSVATENYADNHVASQLVTSKVQNPTSGEQDYAIRWDNSSLRYDLVPDTVDTSSGRIGRKYADGIVSQVLGFTPEKALFPGTNERETGNVTADETNNQIVINVQDLINGDIYYANASCFGYHNNNERYIVQLVHNDNGVENILSEGIANTSGNEDPAMASIPDIQFTTGTVGVQTVYLNVFSETGFFIIDWQSGQISVHK